MEFEELKFDPAYEIAKDQYPYIIRKKGTTKPIAIGKNEKGYQTIHLNRNKYLLHRVIATQYIPNPDDLPEVDHRNQHGDDNRVSNLRWVPHSENQKNKSRYNGVDVTYVGALTDDAIEVTNYGKHELEFIFFDNDAFWYYNGVAFRELTVYEAKRTGALYVQTFDTNDKHVCIYLNKFKREHDLI